MNETAVVIVATDPIENTVSEFWNGENETKKIPFASPEEAEPRARELEAQGYIDVHFRKVY